MSQQKSTNRRAVLWNVQIPGDPYDIRKSMIARLPQHPARFMGDNLQLVCLFQAAQIQRLAQYLDEMTLEMRSLQRIELDRHSYEVQIKELAEKLQLYNQSKDENSKLRQFIKGQSEELQNLQRYRNSAQSMIELQTKYQSVLNELRLSRDNYQALRKTNTDTLSQLAELKYRHQRLQSTLTQQRQSRQRQIKFTIQKSTSQTRHIYQSREYQLKGEITVMKENLMLKNQQISLEKQKNGQLMRQLAEKEEVIGKYMRGEIETQSSTKTQEFLRISKRLEESTYLLQQKEKSIINYKDEITYLNKRIKQLQEDVRKRDDQLKRKQQQIRKRQLQLKSRQLEYHNNPQLLMKIAQFDKKIIIFSSEIQRLKEVISIREKQIVERERQVVFYKEKSFVYQKNIQSLQRDVSQRENVIKRMQFEVKMVDNRDGKIETLANEVSRLNNILREKVNEVSKLQVRVNELVQTESHHLTLIRTKQQAIRVMESRNKQYQTKLNYSQETIKLNHDQINRLMIKVTGLENINIQLRRQIQSKHVTTGEYTQVKLQLDKINQEISEKQVQNKKLREDNQKMFQEITDMERKIITYETTINEIHITHTQKITDKERQLQFYQAEIKEKQRNYLEKIQMYSKSVPKMSQEIQRLHQLLEKRQAEMKRIQQELQMERQRARVNERRNSTEVEIKMLDYERNIAFYQSKGKNYEKLIQEMNEEKIRVNQKIASLENKLRESHNELDKIMSALKAKDLSFDQYQKRTTLLQSTIAQLREQNIKLQSESIKSRQQLQLNLQIIKKLTYQLDVHKRDLAASVSSYTNMKEEYNRLRQVYEEREIGQAGTKHAMDELRHKLAKSENETGYLSRELDERKRRQELQDEDHRQLKLKLSQCQQVIKHMQHTHTTRLQQLRQKMLTQFQTHLQKQAHRYHQLQQAYSQLQMNYQNKSVYFEDQSGKLQGQQARIEALIRQDGELRRQLQEYQQKVMKYEERVAMISQEIERLGMENNTYKGKNMGLGQEVERQREEINTLRVKLQHLTQQQSTNQSDTRAIAQINEELTRTKTQLTNLKQMLLEYEAMKQHAIAQRDELFAITHEQEEKIKQYQGQINGLRNQLGFKERQIMTMKGTQASSSELNLVKEQYTVIHNQYNILQQEYNRLITQLQSAKRKISQLSISSTNHHNLQVKQLQLRIHQVTEHYQSRLQQYQQRIIGYEQTIQKHLRTINVLQVENTQYKGRLDEMEHKLTAQKEIEQQIEELKTEYINIKMENEELNRMLQQMQQQLFESNQDRKRLNSQINQMTLRLNQYNSSENSEIVQLQAENNKLRQTIQQQRVAIQTLRQKLSLLSTQIDQIRNDAEQKIQNINSQYAVLSASHITIQQQNITLKQQVESLQLEITQVSVYQEISQDLEAKYNGLYTAYEETYKVYNEMKVEAETVKGKLHDAEMRIAMLNQEFDKLSQMVIQLRAELTQARIQNDRLKQTMLVRQTQWTQITTTNTELQIQLKRLYQLNQDLTKQLKQTRLRLTDQHALQEKIKHHMFLFVMMCAQVQSLRKRVVETQQECEEVRRSSISPIKTKKETVTTHVTQKFTEKTTF